MGFKVVEYYIRSIVSDGIAKIRDDMSIIDEIFADMMCPPLATMYGKKIVDEIKGFFSENDIPVLSAYGQNQIQLPSITVHLVSSQEDPEYRTMQDQWSFIRVPKKPSIVLGPVYATGYDNSDGKLTFPKETQMKGFLVGRKLYSSRDDVVYTLAGTSSINDGTSTPVEQYVHIVNAEGNVPTRVDFAELFLLSSIDFELYREAAVTFRETFEIRVNANTNSDQAIWLYYIVSYILMRNKSVFESVGLESQTFSTSEFTRDIGKAPNSIWGRTLRFSFLVQHTWREELNPLELVQVDVNAEGNVTGPLLES